MKRFPGFGRTALISWPLAVSLFAAACGGGQDDAGPAVSTTSVRTDGVVVLEVRSPDADEATLAAAAREHGAPGDNETVRYRVRSGDAGVAQAAVAGLRSAGFSGAEIE